MLRPILSEETIASLKSAIEKSTVVAIFTHKGPDGDAIGSSLALAQYLESLGKFVSVYTPNAFPDFLHWLPTSQKIIQHDKHAATAEMMAAKADLMFCLDFNTLDRIGDVAPLVSANSCTKVLIDHHLQPGDFCDITISQPSASSTCELVYRVLDALGATDAISKNIATCIYCGMMTDTGGFTYNSNNSEIYYIISQLLLTGIDKDKIYRNVFNNYSESRFRLMGYILYEKMVYYPEFNASLITLTKEEQKRFSYLRGDTEGIVNIPLQIKGARLSISLREDTESGVIRVSLRSVDDFPCNKVAAEFFNGGGHLNASGGELHCSIDEAIVIVKQALVKYQPLLVKK
ncbi:MAG: bifunctional oligoribonuclease/PAP phosphatase NrnA [Bacteroidaceae bacterium]|nr:bifunctional oligoribonuclease/PAP phosphatase NrnA [Bacteroidaceae bacterium]